VLTHKARGFHSRVFQHEFDHLNGILYPQRIKGMTKFGFIEVLFPKSDLAALERGVNVEFPLAPIHVLSTVKYVAGSAL
jgi:hypothetical protein